MAALPPAIILNTVKVGRKLGPGFWCKDHCKLPYKILILKWVKCHPKFKKLYCRFERWLCKDFWSFIHHKQQQLVSLNLPFSLNSCWLQWIPMVTIYHSRNIEKLLRWSPLLHSASLCSEQTSFYQTVWVMLQGWQVSVFLDIFHFLCYGNLSFVWLSIQL